MTTKRLAEQGRKLAAQRDELIAQGVDPADLDVPMHPGSAHQCVIVADDPDADRWRCEGCGRAWWGVQSGDPS